MTKRLATICLCMLLIGSISPSVQAQAHHDVKTLKGIRAVWVLVENFSDGAKVLGLSKETTKTDVELKLRLAGMRVVTEEEGFKLPGGPYVYVVVNLTDTASAASVDISLNQDAKLESNDEIVTGVDTWSRGVVIAHPGLQGIRDSIKDLVDTFLNDWLSVNPKK
jgi:hypothetical protein